MTDFLSPAARMETESDYREFVRWLLFVRGVNFHPDNGFQQYVDEKGAATFSKAEAAVLDGHLARAFAVLADRIYDIGLEEFRIYEATRRASPVPSQPLP